MHKLFWGVAMVGAFIGGCVLILSVLGANGAPQEAAGAAIAMALGVLPYVLARAVDEMARPKA